MFNLTIICIILAAVTSMFWVLEGRDAYKAFNTQPEWKKGLKAVFNISIATKWILNMISQSKWLIINIICTVLIVKIFSLGGLIGTCMGFMISNVISLSLLIARLKERKTS